MLSSAVLVLAASIVVGQAKEMPSNYEHLKSYDALIGTWVYDGPLLEDVPGLGSKETKIHVEIPWQWILNKSVVESGWKIDLEGGVTLAAKILIGWDPVGKRIISGGMDSAGGHGLSTITYDEKNKTWVEKIESVEPDGKETSQTFLATLVDADTLVVQAKDRTGGTLPPEGPKYTLKRIKR